MLWPLERPLLLSLSGELLRSCSDAFTLTRSDKMLLIIKAGLRFLPNCWAVWKFFDVFSFVSRSGAGEKDSKKEDHVLAKPGSSLALVVCSSLPSDNAAFPRSENRIARSANTLASLFGHWPVEELRWFILVWVCRVCLWPSPGIEKSIVAGVSSSGRAAELLFLSFIPSVLLDWLNRALW